MSDYLPADVSDLSAQQRAVLEETSSDWRELVRASPSSLLGVPPASRTACADASNLFSKSW
ncbi:hypothetical protein EW053_36620 [Streptomyces sp. IB2014 016-6]|nr:hypothetical protein EW053_36620 [Streptomyces sp. IB2014 016-6]